MTAEKRKFRTEEKKIMIKVMIMTKMKDIDQQDSK